VLFSTIYRRNWLLRNFEDGCPMPPACLRQVVNALVVKMYAELTSDGGSKNRCSSLLFIEETER
jgi:hypothetical protein